MMDGRYLPLIALGGGIMGGRLGRGLQGFAQATMQGQQFDREARQDEQRSKMLELQTGQMEAQVAAQKQQQQLLGEITAGMDPQQAAHVRALGPDALQNLYNQTYGPKKAPELQTLYKGGTQEQGYFGDDGNWVAVSSAPRWQPQQAPQVDQFQPLTTEEVKSLNLAPGTVAQRNLRTGDIDIIQAPQAGAQVEPYQLLTPDEVKAAGYAPGTVVQRSLRTGKLDVSQQPQNANEPIVSIMGPDGKAIYVPQSQAIGQAPAAKREDDPSFDRITTLRKEFESLPEVKSYKEVIPVVNSARASAKQNTRASDLDLVYAVGKVLDPNSVVREGEQIMITNSQSPANQLAGYINSLSGGAKFTDELRADLLKLLDNRAIEWQNMYNQRVAQYRRLGNQNGLDASQIVDQLPNIIGSTPTPPGGVPDFSTPAPGSPQATQRRNDWGLR